MPAIIRHRYEGLERIEINKFQINYKDILALNYFYQILHEWFIENNYATREDEKFGETFYLQREDPKFGKEVWFRWRLSRNLDPQDTPLWRIDIDIDAHILGWKEVELIVKNKKVKMDKAEVEFNVTPALIFDYKKALAKHKIFKKYTKYVKEKLLRKEFTRKKFEVYSESMRISEAMKEYLNLQTYSSDKEWSEFWKTAKSE